MKDSQHKSVLLHESIRGLAVNENDVVVDMTLGGGGHSEAIASLLGEAGALVGIDADSRAIERTHDKLKHAKCKCFLKRGNFRNIDTILAELNISQVNKVLFDLGLSSQEIDDSGRGFTFQKDEPLLMTLSDSPAAGDLTARTIVNSWSAENLETIIKSYGDERYAKSIARRIVESREEKPIETTFDLVAIILEATPKRYHHMKIHPATRTFQALRMTVNDEARSLTEALQKSFALLAPHGRIAVIAFHSIEDRIVKHFFKTLVSEEHAEGITKKPITPTESEIKENPRSRSAKLRIISKLQ